MSQFPSIWDRSTYESRRQRPWALALCLLITGTLIGRAAESENVVLYLPLEDAVNPIDLSDDPTPVSVRGTLNSVDGQFGGQAVEFNGSNVNLIEVTDADKLEGMTALTIEAWVRPRGLAAQDGMSVVSKRVGTNIQDSYNLFVWTGQIVNARINGNAGGALTSSTALVDETWYHLALVFDGASAGENWWLYVNGVQEDAGTHPASAVNPGDASLWVGELDSVRGFAWNGALDEIGIWNVALTEEEISEVMTLGKTKLFRGGIAFSPDPGDEADDVARDSDLTWAAGEFAATHDVYLGTSFDDVNDADRTQPLGQLVSQNQTETQFEPGRLTFDRTYFWRVDEVNGAPDFSIIKGDVWSFTVEPFSIPITDVTATASSSFGTSTPEKTVDGSGLADDLHGTGAGDMWISGGVPASIEYTFDRVYKLDALWIWNSNQTIETFVGFGAKDVVVEHSLDGETWTALEGVDPLAAGTGAPDYAHNNTIDLAGAVARHVRITVNTVQGFSPQASLSEVRFFYIPTFATRPSPAAGSTGVAPDVTLSWGRDGREAETHDVYLGTDANELPLAETVDDSAYDTAAADLQLGETYYWRVDEVNEAMGPSTWAGDLWHFTTVEALVVDDMEAYADEEFKEIWATWIDGFDDATNASLVGANPGVGNFSPETGIVHGGGQSLPMHFDNSGTAFSEATRTFDQARDWTRFGVTTLSLWVRQGLDNSGGALYLKIGDTKVMLVDESTYPDGFDPGWVAYQVDLTAMSVASVASISVGVEGAGAQGVIYVDDIRLYRDVPPATRLNMIGAIIEAESGAVTPPYEIRSDRPEASGRQYIMVPNGAGNANNDPAPAGQGRALYTLDVPADGDYVIALRGLTEVPDSGSDDSVWINIPGMIVNDPAHHATGFLRCNDILHHPEGAFVWDLVRDDLAGVTDPVIFTLTAGQHELQISRREDGTALDAIALMAVD